MLTWLVTMMTACEQAKEPTVSVSHAIGVTLQRPQSSEVLPAPDRLIIRPAGWKTRRSAYTLTISMASGSPAAGYTERSEGERTFLHREQVGEGGSGGGTHELEGRVEVDGLTVHVRFVEQSESREAPNAWVYWHAIETLQRQG